jgi:ubiquinone biosynthesis monooxygenase Coq7|tara:strand:- start:1745 stop:2386 length:642 start_codon:yes stop_codon:yes gene_type:complete
MSSPLSNNERSASSQPSAILGAASRASEQASLHVASVIPPFSQMPRWLQAELRSDHAGEYGAVMIYRGILAVSRDHSVRDFAERHIATERDHLRLMEETVPSSARTQLLPLWWLMGWLTGALPAIFGRHAVFATIEAVETFVDHHYRQQIDRLAEQERYESLRELLLQCQEDEVSHRDEAAGLAGTSRGILMRLWSAIVGAGSATAVIAARRI